MADIDMKPADEKKKEEEEKAEEKKQQEAKKQPPTVPEEIKTNVTLIERAVSTLEPRFTLRVLRTLTALRKRLDNKNLVESIDEVYPPGTSSYITYLCTIRPHCFFRFICQENPSILASTHTNTGAEDGY